MPKHILCFGMLPRDCKGLILSVNMIAVRQIVHLLSSARGVDMQVLYRKEQASLSISKRHPCLVIADIESSDLGGLAVLTHTKRHWPDIKTFAITRNEESFENRLAEGLGGCQAFFYLDRNKPGIDMQRGLAAELSKQIERIRLSRIAKSTKRAMPLKGDDKPSNLFSLLTHNSDPEI